MKIKILAVKIKVLLGYFTLVVLASLIIWVIYTEILQYSKGKVDFNPSTNKFIRVNNILTNLYQAEALERNYIQNGQISQDYLEIMKTISLQIDTLVLMLDNQTQQIQTYNIKKLLQVKQRNLKELFDIKNTNSSKAIYQKGLKKITSVKSSADHTSKGNANTITSSDSTNERKNITGLDGSDFNTDKYIDSILSVRTTKSPKINNHSASSNATDSIARYITAIITEIRNEGDALEIRQIQKEQEILATDRTITFQLRQMLSYLEKEELIKSFQSIKDQQIRNKKATMMVVLIGCLALVTILIFLINILKDITRSQRYRQDLELANAYSESLLNSKEQLMLSLTHDLKSPLNSIIGFTGFMEQDPELSSRLRKYLQNISSASKHILKLVTDLLDLARLKTGKLAVDRIPFDLLILIEDIMEGFSPQARVKNIELQLHFKHSLSKVYMGDPSRITQIFDNLISNAINFTESGSVTVLVSKLAELKSSDQIQVEVIDTGIGISAENFQRVFEEFNRVSTTKKQYEGTGLGLTITKKIVELLQGTIHLSSIPGKGSHFTLVLLLERGEQVDITYRMSNVKNHGTLADISGIKIWLIDDDQMLLEMTTIILESVGAEVHAFSDPQIAISSFSKGCADLLITDIQMPEINGIEVLNQIREKNGGQISAIAISGKKSVQNEFDGFTAFVQKPYQAYSLIDIIAGQLPSTISSQYSTNSASRVAKGYKLDQLLAFVEGDHESLKQILVSFIHSSNQNLMLFRQYLEEENINMIAHISHKMLSLIRQLEAYDIVELLAELEQNEFSVSGKENYLSLGKLAVERIETLLQAMEKEENIQI